MLRAIVLIRESFKYIAICNTSSRQPSLIGRPLAEGMDRAPETNEKGGMVSTTMQALKCEFEMHKDKRPPVKASDPGDGWM